ncbi:MAG: glutamate 5-kinase [Candidatus Vecturithrix sp.]|jgi:glutamate 5-kinase|nr:glutamate 5-kinase [Candidatus Vecturithrix sp.]
MYQRIVIKLGTSVLTGGTPQLDRAHMVELVRQCAFLHKKGRDIIICTSGAVAAGRERLGFPELPNIVTTKQMLAAVGQSKLMFVWESLFDIYGIHVGQMLLTRADVEDRSRYLNARDTLQTLLEHQIIPIINENDAVATTEIKVGDNDNLSALVALLAEADVLLILTDLPGLFTADPRTNPEARLIPEVRVIDDALYKIAGTSVSGLGVGGMSTKLQAADVARRAGIDVIIAAGRESNIITRLISGETLGTRFPAVETPLDHWKRWIFAGPTPSGSAIVDDGASRALRRQNSSLLPSGILAIEGEFERGDTICIVNQQGKILARGITRYSQHELHHIKGCHSDQIVERLGYTSGAVIVHRRDMILT